MRTKKDDGRTTVIGRARGGRPRLEDHDRRTGRIGVPVNEEEEKAIECKAAAVYMKKASSYATSGWANEHSAPCQRSTIGHTVNWVAWPQVSVMCCC